MGESSGAYQAYMSRLFTELQLRGVPRTHFLALSADGLDASTWCADLSETFSWERSLTMVMPLLSERKGYHVVPAYDGSTPCPAILDA